MLASTAVGCGSVAPDPTIEVMIWEPDGSDKLSGVPIQIHVTFRSEDVIHNVAVELVNVTAGSTVHAFRHHAHVAGSYAYRTSVTPVVSSDSDFELTASATDHSDVELGRASRSFRVRAR